MSETASRTDADFEAFYERHWKYVYRLCFSYLQNEADAEDVTEDIFVKVLTGDCVFRDLTHERKWLCICAINLCKDRLKRFDRSRVDSLDDDAMPEIAAPSSRMSFCCIITRAIGRARSQSCWTARRPQSGIS